MLLHPRTLKCAAIAGALVWSATSVHAASDPTGVWLDHNGRGAVEIAPCADGNGLCGYVVHIKNAANANRCGLQILGNVTPGGGGWIYSPERKRKYPVALTRLSDDSLRVVGNAGSLFSRTFTWNRAPDSIARCGETVAAAPTKSAEPEASAPVSKSGAATETATERAPAAPPVLVGASSGAVALLARPRPRIAEAEPPAAPVEEAVQPAAVSDDANTEAPEAETGDTFDAEPERTCKFRIPYVGRVIDVPCRD